MSDQPLCEMGCGKPAHDGAICAECSGHLVRNLHTIGELWPALRDAMSKPAPQAPKFGPVRKEDAVEETGTVIPTGIDINLKAADLCRDILRSVLQWSGGSVQHATVPALCQRLARDIRRLRRVSGYATDAADYVRRMEALVDSVPPPGIELGFCTVQIDGKDGKEKCGVHLVAQPGQSFVTCWRCHWQYPVAQTQEWLLEQADDWCATTKQIHRLGVTIPEQRTGRDGAVTVEHVPVSFDSLQDRITYWVKTGRLQSKGTEPGEHGGKDQPTYRVGTVRNLLNEAKARPRKKASA